MQPPPLRKPKLSNAQQYAGSTIHSDDDNRPVLIAFVIFLILLLLMLLILLFLIFGMAGSGGGNRAHNHGAGGNKTGGADKDSVGGGAGKKVGDKKNTKDQDQNAGSTQSALKKKQEGDAKRAKEEAVRAGMAQKRLDKKRRDRQLKSQDQSTIATLGSKGGAMFFGAAAKGDNFIYVIDVSASMGNRDRLGRAIRELKKSIEALPEKSYFGVILYHSEKVVHPPLEFCQATKENKELLSKYLATVRLGQSTYPVTAILHAVKLKPDAVFLLSDGDFSPSHVNQMTMGNKERIPIHTVAMDGERRTLLELAERNNGYYTVAKK